jgi:hypothetical protein
VLSIPEPTLIEVSLYDILHSGKEDWEAALHALVSLAAFRTYRGWSDEEAKFFKAVFPKTISKGGPKCLKAESNHR